jgi:hypothetical protein
LLSLKASEWQMHGMGNEEVFLLEYQFTVKVRPSDPPCNFGMKPEFAVHWLLRTQGWPGITLDAYSASVIKTTLHYSKHSPFFGLYSSSIY